MVHKKMIDDSSKHLDSRVSDNGLPILYYGKITKSAILAAILDFFKILNMHFNCPYIDYMHTQYQENRSTSFRDIAIFLKIQDGRQSAILNSTTPVFNRVLKVHPKIIHKKFGDDISKRIYSREIMSLLYFIIGKLRSQPLWQPYWIFQNFKHAF